MGIHEFGWTRILPKTGQVTSYKTGDDGAYQWGSKVSPRFVDTANNTILDYGTGLEWVKEPAKIYPNGTGALSSVKGPWVYGVPTTYGTVSFDTTDKKLGSASAVFDGSTAYVDTHNVWNGGDNHPFTVSGWVKIHAVVSDAGIYCKEENIYGGYAFLTVVNHSSGNNIAVYSNTSGFVASSTTTLTLDTWYYLTWAYDGVNINFYKNGSFISSGAFSYTDDMTATYILGTYYYNANHLNGKMDEMALWSRCLTSGEIAVLAASSSEIDPGTQTNLQALFHFNSSWANSVANYKAGDLVSHAYDADVNTFYPAFADGHYYNSGDVIYHANISYQDVLYTASSSFLASNYQPGVSVGWQTKWNQSPSPANWAEYVNYDGPFSAKFGAGCAVMVYSGDTITVANSSDFDFGTGAFTIDWWEYRTTSYNGAASISRDDAIAHSGYTPFLLGYNASGTLQVYMSSTGSSWDIASARSLGALNINGWHHFAVVRSGNNFYNFQDGVQTATWSSSASLLASSGDLQIGTYYTNVGQLYGYIDELRISKGIARWTTGFTPPVSEYSPDSYTKLLLHLNTNFSDSSASSQVATAHGLTKIGTGIGSFVWDGFGSTYYHCKLANYSGDHQPTSDPNYSNVWNSLSAFFWMSSNNYTAGNYVTDGPYLYICLLSNYSGTYQPNVDPNWYNVWTYTMYWGAWDGGTTYYPGSYVTYSGTLYVCNNTNSGKEPDLFPTDWTSVPSGAWVSDHSYSPGNVVLIYGQYYTCTVAHFSGTKEPGTAGGASYWSSVSFTTWASDTSYSVNDVVYSTSAYNDYKCTVAHFSGTRQPGSGSGWATYWETETIGTWAIDTNYSASTPDVVSGGYGYFDTCIVSHRSSNHEPIARSDWGTYWTEGSARSFSTWVYNTVYTVGNVVEIAGSPNRYFVCISGHTSTYSDTPWSTTNWTDKWAYIPTYYVCIADHTSDNTNEPEYGASFGTYWTRNYWTNSAANFTTPLPLECNYGIVVTSALNYNGHTDWRLPNLHEVASLLKFSTYNPMIDVTLFPHTQAGNYWSTSSDPSSTSYAFVTNFYANGGAGFGGTTEIKYGTTDSVYLRPCRAI